MDKVARAMDQLSQAAVSAAETMRLFSLLYDLMDDEKFQVLEEPGDGLSAPKLLTEVEDVEGTN